jgi:hypothetical protein
MKRMSMNVDHGGMRDLGVTDSELRLIAALRRTARERGGQPPSIGFADELLNERALIGQQVQIE